MYIALKWSIRRKWNWISTDSGLYMFVRERFVPPARPEIWAEETWTSAMIKNGISPDDVYSSVGNLFGEKKEFGWYVYRTGLVEIMLMYLFWPLANMVNKLWSPIRLGEREWEHLGTYLAKMDKNIPLVKEQNKECAELADLHTITTDLYTKTLLDSKTTAHFCGLAVDPAERGRGLADKLVQFTLNSLKAEGYTDIVVECTGPGSRRVMEKQGFKLLKAIDYQVPVKDNTQFCIFHKRLRN